MTATTNNTHAESSSEQQLRAEKPSTAKRPLSKRITSAIGWGLFVVAMVLMWPVALGGSTSYVVVTGKSMEPTLHAGDFVVLRTGEYQVGDVVSYEPFDDVPAQVIHRIIDMEEDGTYILQGDNNSFVDPYFPTADEVNGKFVFSIPKIGEVTWFLAKPLVWGSLLLIAGGLYLYGGKPKTDPKLAVLQTEGLEP